MRSAEILTLTWDKVDLKRSTVWVSADASKSCSSRVAPLNSEALDVLNARAKGINVFTRPTRALVKSRPMREFLRGPSPKPGSRISASMTCVTPGRAGMSNPAHLCSC
ncbi:tyrosine-type recombinase/integrase [Delftia tsuruhatensis]